MSLSGYTPIILSIPSHSSSSSPPTSKTVYYKLLKSSSVRNGNDDSSLADTTTSNFTPNESNINNEDGRRVIFINTTAPQVGSIMRNFGISSNEWYIEVDYNLPLHTNVETRLYEGVTGKTVKGQTMKELSKDGIVVIGVTGGKKNLKKVEKGLGKNKNKVVVCDDPDEEEEGGSATTWDRVFETWSCQTQDMAVLQSRSDGVVMDYSER
jgi:hypothetical protein